LLLSFDFNDTSLVYYSQCGRTSAIKCYAILFRLSPKLKLRVGKFMV